MRTRKDNDNGRPARRSQGSANEGRKPAKRSFAAKEGDRPPRRNFRTKEEEGTRREPDEAPKRRRISSKQEGDASFTRKTTSRDQSAAPFKRRTASKEEGDASNKRSYSSKNKSDASNKRSFSSRNESDASKRRSFSSKEEGDAPNRRRFSSKGEGDAPFKRRTPSKDQVDAPFKRRTPSKDQGDAPFKRRTPSRDQGDAPFKRRTPSRDQDAPMGDEGFGQRKTRSYGDEERPARKSFSSSRNQERRPGKPFRSGSSAPRKAHQESADGTIRLNKYIANAGICSRREADDLIISGAVKVNGEIVTTLGTRISMEDRVQIGDQTLAKETMRYVLVNKPKGYISTVEDPEGRKTVMFLVREACRERIYPVGRLDRETTGVLLLTNDGELTKKLTHPSHGIRKVYHVSLDKPLEVQDLKTLEQGVELEDGFTKADAVAFAGDGKDRRQLGLELHSGKNRVVRRMFEELGYTVTKLDRVVFAGLTKKDLPRGRWRLLTQDEVNFLKML